MGSANFGRQMSARDRVKIARRRTVHIDDFVNALIDSTLAANGSAASSAVSAGTDYFGTFGLSTGTTLVDPNQRSGISTNSSFQCVMTGAGPLVYEADFILSATPTATEDYSFRAGFFDTNLRSTIVAGIFLEVEYASGTAARYSLITRQNSTETRTILTGTPDTNRHHVTIRVDAAGGNVYADIDGVQVGTTTLNIPTGNGTTQDMGYGYVIEKTVGTGVNVTCKCDRVACGQDFTTAR